MPEARHQLTESFQRGLGVRGRSRGEEPLALRRLQPGDGLPARFLEAFLELPLGGVGRVDDDRNGVGVAEQVCRFGVGGAVGNRDRHGAGFADGMHGAERLE